MLTFWELTIFFKVSFHHDSHPPLITVSFSVPERTFPPPLILVSGTLYFVVGCNSTGPQSRPTYQTERNGQTVYGKVPLLTTGCVTHNDRVSPSTSTDTTSGQGHGNQSKGVSGHLLLCHESLRDEVAGVGGEGLGGASCFGDNRTPSSKHSRKVKNTILRRSTSSVFLRSKGTPG